MKITVRQPKPQPPQKMYWDNKDLPAGTIVGTFENEPRFLILSETRYMDLETLAMYALRSGEFGTGRPLFTIAEIICEPKITKA
jgi:hypothetical protein